MLAVVVVAFYDHDCYVIVLSSYDMMHDGYCAYWFTISTVTSSPLNFIIYIVHTSLSHLNSYSLYYLYYSSLYSSSSMMMMMILILIKMIISSCGTLLIEIFHFSFCVIIQERYNTNRYILYVLLFLKVTIKLSQYI